MKVLVTEKLSEHKYKTPEGYLICVDAVLARTGKQSYMRSELFDTDDETEVDVDRRPEEVFSPQTLASFENKPITKNHPDEDVNSENIKEYSVGFVRDVHKGYDNGQPVILGTLVIQDAETIKEIEDGEYTQLSCGYNCDVVDEENPQQKCIRGNHVALCEQGRAGNARIVDSKMKKDSNLTEVIKFLKQNLFNFDVYYDKINFDSTEEMRNATELLRKYGYKYDIYNSNSIDIKDSKMKKDELYTLEELRKMRIGNYKEIDIYRIDGKFSTNPNTSKERFDTFEEVKRYIDNGFRDSIKDESYVSNNKNEIINLLNKWSDNPKESVDIIMSGGRFIRIFKDKFANKYIAWTSRLPKKEFDRAGKAVDYVVLMGLDDLLKDSIKDEGGYKPQLVTIKSPSDITLSLIVNTVKKYAIQVKKITNGTVEGTKLILQIFAKEPGTGKFVWMEFPIIFNLDYYALRNIEENDKYAVEKFQKEIKQKLNSFTGRTLYEDNSLSVDSIKDVEPRVDEDKDEFISRFMRETKEEYPDEKQRLAVAYSYWNKKSTKDTVEDYQSTKTSYERIEEMPRSARKWVAETDNKKAGLLAIKNGIEDIINAAEPSIRNELRRRGDKILQDLKAQFRIEDEESTYTEVTKELEKDYNNFTKDSKLTLDQIINIYKTLKKNK